MGNCQAIDTATLVIQHPCGRSEKLYWSVSANDIMKINPGHYVALLISTTSVSPPPSATASSTAAAPGTTPAAAAAAPNSVRVTRIKLLRPTDTLALGQVYRLITAKEVMKVLSAKKYAKMKKGQVEEKLMSSGLELPAAPRRSDNNNHHHTKKTDTQVAKPERHSRNSQQQQHKTTSSTPRPRTWQPSLNSISESAS